MAASDTGPPAAPDMGALGPALKSLEDLARRFGQAGGSDSARLIVKPPRGCARSSAGVTAKQPSCAASSRRPAPISAFSASVAIGPGAMRIAVFSAESSGSGAARAMRRLVAGLAKRGHHVDLLLPADRRAPASAIQFLAGRRRAGGAGAVSLRRGLLYPPAAQPSLGHALQRAVPRLRPRPSRLAAQLRRLEPALGAEFSESGSDSPARGYGSAGRLHAS